MEKIWRQVSRGIGGQQIAMRMMRYKGFIVRGIGEEGDGGGEGMYHVSCRFFGKYMRSA